MRPHPLSWQGQPLRQSEQWERASVRVAKANEPPLFSLDG